MKAWWATSIEFNAGMAFDSDSLRVAPHSASAALISLELASTSPALARLADALCEVTERNRIVRTAH